MVGEPGTGDAFKGWIDYGKDESQFQPGTNWRGELLKTGDEGNKESKQKEESKAKGSETETKEETGDEKQRTIEEAKKESGDGTYDVKLEL